MRSEGHPTRVSRKVPYGTGLGLDIDDERECGGDHDLSGLIPYLERHGATVSVVGDDVSREIPDDLVRFGASRLDPIEANVSVPLDDGSAVVGLKAIVGHVVLPWLQAGAQGSLSH